jgi:hypothetical protein
VGDWITDFVRYHVLIRVFDGDTKAWLAVLEDKGMPAPETIFVQWLRDRLRCDPDLLPRLRALVDESRLWPTDARKIAP